MSDTVYQGQTLLPCSLLYTPVTGTAFGSVQAQLQTLTPPDDKLGTFKFVPISGANSNLQQFGPTYTAVTTMMVTVTYKGTEHAAAQVCKTARIQGTLTVTYGDGATDVWTSSATQISALLTGIKRSVINAEGEVTDDLEFTVTMPPVFTAGS